MKGTTAVSSATVLVTRLQNQHTLALVRICILSIASSVIYNINDTVLFVRVADPPRINIHPRNLKNAVRGKPAEFIVQATGTKPLSYQWLHWKLVGEEGGSGDWQSCPAEWCDGATLTIPNVQKSNEGSYCCVISNCAGRQASNPVNLSVGKINAKCLQLE